MTRITVSPAKKGRDCRNPFGLFGANPNILQRSLTMTKKTSSLPVQHQNSHYNKSVVEPATTNSQAFANLTEDQPTTDLPLHCSLQETIHFFRTGDSTHQSSKLTNQSTTMSITHGKPTEGMCCFCTMEDITEEDGNYGACVRPSECVENAMLFALFGYSCSFASCSKQLYIVLVAVVNPSIGAPIVGSHDITSWRHPLRLLDCFLDSELEP
jgi:hypothetical protein